jgi:hypothetical protein
VPNRSKGHGQALEEWRLTRNARPLLRAEERVVQRMSNENPEVKFFTRYESANALFDVEIAAPKRQTSR